MTHFVEAQSRILDALTTVGIQWHIDKLETEMANIEDEFFQLDKPYDEIFYQSNFWEIIENSDDVVDLLYWPDKIESAQPPAKWL